MTFRFGMADFQGLYMDVSKNSGTPKWMVGVPLFLETSIYIYIHTHLSFRLAICYVIFRGQTVKKIQT